MLKLSKILVCFLFSASNIIAQSISIQGIFSEAENNEIGLSIHFYAEKLPSRTLYQKIENSQSEQTIIFPLSSKEIAGLWWFRLFTKQQNGTIYLKEIKLSNNFKIDATGIKRGLYVYEKTCPNEIELVKGQHYFVFQEGRCVLIIDSSIFYQSIPINFQLFLRLFFLAALLFCLFILCKQTLTQRFPVFVIALFLVTLSFKIDYTNYTMGFMLLAMFLVFVHNKPRRFFWQPIFYVIFAMYLLNIIGLSYTNDFKIGIKRLDAAIVFILFPVVFSMIQFSKKNLILLLRFFVWTVIIFCAFGLLSYVIVIQELTWNMIFAANKNYAPILMTWPAHPHPSFLSAILLMAVPVALYLRYHQGEKQITMVEMLLGVFLPIVFTILTGARVGILITPLLLGLGYIFYCKFKPVLKWGLLAATGILSLGVLLHVSSNISDRFDDPIRTNLRKIAISAIKEKPVFGWGTGSAKLLIQSGERAHDLGIGRSYNFNQFHNQYLEDMVQFGIAGILLLMVLLGWMLSVSICEKNYLLLSLLTIYALFFWTESVLFISKGLVPFTFWLCFLISNRNELLNKIVRM